MRAARTQSKLRLVVSNEHPHETTTQASAIGLSRSVWGIDWKSHFPLSLDGGKIVARVGDYSKVASFLQSHMADIYGRDPVAQSFVDTGTGARQPFYETAGDFFLFQHDLRTIGTFVGNAVDWATYYVRNIAILPDFQGRKLYSGFLAHLLEVLKLNGVQRVEVDIAPSNLGHIHLVNKLQFNITGFQVSERWGALVRFTKFFNARSEDVFLDRFCSGVKPQRTSISLRRK